MGECEKCGFLECRCPDHIAQNYVPKYKLRKIVEDMEGKPDCSEEFWAWKIKKLLDGG